jgi:hypothetical protein
LRKLIVLKKLRHEYSVISSTSSSPSAVVVVVVVVVVAAAAVASRGEGLGAMEVAIPEEAAGSISDETSVV